MVRLIHIRIPEAVTACLNLAAKIEIDHSRLYARRDIPLSVKAPQLETMRGFIDHYTQIATDLEGLKYISPTAVENLCQANSFLRPFQVK